MKYNTNVKHTTLEAFVTTVNDLGIELIINEALREVRKRQPFVICTNLIKKSNLIGFKHNIYVNYV